MQKRPTYSFQFGETKLSPHFPFECSERFIQKDEPITFLHWHNTIEIGYCHKGSGIFVVGEKVFTFSDGDVVFIAENDVHLAQSSRGSKSVWTWLYLRLPQLLIPFITDAKIGHVVGAIRSGIYTQQKDPAISQAVVRTIAEAQIKNSGYENLVRCTIYELLISMFRKISKVGPELTSISSAKSPTSAHIERIKPAIENICNQYSAEIVIGKIAALCFMSETNFRRFFYKVMGKTPLEYIQALRISIAAAQLVACRYSMDSSIH